MKRTIVLVAAALLLATPAFADEQRIAEQLSALDAYIAANEAPAEVATQPAPPRQPPIQAQPKQVVLPFEDIGIYDELPDYVYSMPRPVYIKWCKMQNAGAYRKAQRMADDFAARHPLIDTYVQDSDYTTTVEQEQHEEVDRNSADFSGRQSTKYKGQNKQFTYRPDRYGGGPVLLLNPYTPRPAKVIFQQGLAFVADPDGTIKSHEEAMKLLEEATK